MQAPVDGSSLNIRENFDHNENYSSGLNFDQFGLSSFGNVSYHGSQFNPFQNDYLVKQSTFSTDALKPMIQNCENSQISTNGCNMSYNIPNSGLNQYFNPHYHQSVQHIPNNVNFAEMDMNKSLHPQCAQVEVKIENPENEEHPISLSTKEGKSNSFVSNTQIRVSNPKSDTKIVDKDERYLQRRLKNNLAAKRSRDNRKRREDTIALRASYLERTNLILQSQIIALKKEICLLRGLPFDSNYKPMPVENYPCVNSSHSDLMVSAGYTSTFPVVKSILDNSCKSTDVHFPTNNFNGDCV